MSLLAVTAIAIVRTNHLFAVAMLSGVYSFLSAGVFVALDAVDVAFTEAAVGAGISTVLVLAALSLTSRRERPPTHAPWVPLGVCAVAGVALFYASFDLPHFGDPQAPIHHHVAPRYIDGATTETGVPNIVTGVLASYRGFDTMGEVIVVFTAGIGVLILIGRGAVARARRRS